MPLPTISGSPAPSVAAGERYLFQPAAADADGDTLRFKIQGRPGWASFESSTGRLLGIPTVANAGTYANIVISVTDGKRGTTWIPLPAFSITVEASGNLPPTIDGTPVTSADAKFTWEYCTHPEGGCAQASRSTRLPSMRMRKPKPMNWPSCRKELSACCVVTS